jgi:Protein of unknown function (DUF2844)
MKLRSGDVRSFVRRSFAFLALLAVSTPAWATLGDNAASVLADQARMKGTLHSIDKSAYVVHEITTPAGAKVREYISPGGAVFGIAWDSQLPVDLQQLLGPYYQQAKQVRQAREKAAQQASTQDVPQPRRAPVVVNTPGLVLYQSGHLHSLHGIAYIPQLIPQGVQASAIR